MRIAPAAQADTVEPDLVCCDPDAAPLARARGEAHCDICSTLDSRRATVIHRTIRCQPLRLCPWRATRALTHVPELGLGLAATSPRTSAPRRHSLRDDGQGRRNPPHQG